MKEMQRNRKKKSRSPGAGQVPPIYRRRKIVGIAEENANLLRILHRHLAREGYKVVEFHTAEHIVDSVLKNNVDVLLVDLAVPHCDGIELARFVRRVSSVPLIIMAGREEIETRIAGLDAGADDYLTKPFDLRELSARLRAVFRRKTESAGLDESRTTSWRIGGSQLLLMGYQLVNDGKRTARLTEREFTIFVRLLEQLGTPVTREELVAHTTGEDRYPNDRRIDVHIARIRKKLSAIGEHGLVIRAIRSFGYVAEGIAESMPATI
jgi:DNA-binding response OmpR family regulator